MLYPRLKFDVTFPNIFDLFFRLQDTLNKYHEREKRRAHPLAFPPTRRKQLDESTPNLKGLACGSALGHELTLFDSKARSHRDQEADEIYHRDGRYGVRAWKGHHYLQVRAADDGTPSPPCLFVVFVLVAPLTRTTPPSPALPRPTNQHSPTNQPTNQPTAQHRAASEVLRSADDVY